MIITKSFINDENGNSLGFSFSESRGVTVLYAKKNEHGLLQCSNPNCLEENISQSYNTNLGVVQLIHSQLANNNSQVLDAYNNAVVINKHGNECSLYVLVKKEN